MKSPPRYHLCLDVALLSVCLRRAAQAAADFAFRFLASRCVTLSTWLRLSLRTEHLIGCPHRKAEMAALTRDELVGILTKIVHASRARLSETRTVMTSKPRRCWRRCAGGMNQSESMCTMSQRPSRRGCQPLRRQCVEVRVDAALTEQLRAA